MRRMVEMVDALAFKNPSEAVVGGPRRCLGMDQPNMRWRSWMASCSSRARSGRCHVGPSRAEIRSSSWATVWTCM